jgi:PAS domain S-box-containing protein
MTGQSVHTTAVDEASCEQGSDAAVGPEEEADSVPPPVDECRLVTDGGDPLGDPDNHYVRGPVDINAEHLLETVGEPVFAVDRDGEFVFVNDRLSDLLSTPPEDLLGEHFTRFADGLDAGVATEKFESFLDSGETRSTFRFDVVTPDGQIPVEARLDTLADAGCAGVVRDISDRTRAESRFDELFENLTDPAIVATVSGDDAVFVDVNSAFERVFGYEASMVADRSVDELLVPPDDMDTATDLNQQILARQSVDHEVRRETASGELRDFRFQAVNIEDDGPDQAVVYALYTDITDRKRTQRRLAALHDANHELLAAETPAAVAASAVEAASNILDHEANGVHLYHEEVDGLVPVAVSEAAREIIGEPPTLPAGDSLAWQAYDQRELVARDDIRDDDDAYDADSEMRSELFVPLGDHGVLILSSPATGAFDGTERSLAQVLGANIEAALDQVEREQALRVSRRQLERQNERLDEFASAVSHDIRNPLNVAQTRLELAQTDVDSEHLDAIADAHERMGSLVEDALNWAREGGTVEEPETEPIDLAEMVEACLTELDLTDATVTVETDAVLRADRSRFQRIVENLLNNAVEHGSTSPDSQAKQDGVAQASTGSQETAGVDVVVGTLDDADGFYVADDGPGVPVDQRADVFESGFTTAATGTGFGLAIVEQIVEAHGWTIDLTDSEAGGARFEVSGIDSLS